MVERHKGPTPNGGDYSEVYYCDNEGNSVEKSVAKRIIIREMKNDGSVVNEIFGDL